MIIDEKEYKRGVKEVLVILNSISNEFYNKIPTDIILMLEKFQDNSYDYELDFHKEFSEQNILDVSKAILSNFYRDYWASDLEKDEIIKKENSERIKLENEKRKQYNTDYLFKKSNIEKNIDNHIPCDTSKALVVKENIFQKVMREIKAVLKMFK